MYPRPCHVEVPDFLQVTFIWKAGDYFPSKFKRDVLLFLEVNRAGAVVGPRETAGTLNGKLAGTRFYVGWANDNCRSSLSIWVS